MKVKRIRQEDGSYQVQVREGHNPEPLVTYVAKSTTIRLSTGYAWEFGPLGEDSEGVAFSLREVEQRALTVAINCKKEMV